MLFTKDWMAGVQVCAALVAVVMLAAGCMAANPKRGFVADGSDATCDDPILLSNAGWYYDYDVEDPYRHAGLSGDCARAAAMDTGRFTPMNWCLDSMSNPIPSYVQVSYCRYYMGPSWQGACGEDLGGGNWSGGGKMSVWKEKSEELKEERKQKKERK